MKRVASSAVIVLAMGWAPAISTVDRMVGAVARAQDEADRPALVPHGQDRAPNAPRSPAQAIQAMSVPEGFRVELVAAEPDIINPVAMTFDERGRTWITESLEYPRREPGPGRDRVKVLEDTNGDGTADRFTVFAGGLNIPSGIAVGYGGVWVANAPDILFFRDSDHDGKADSREVVVTGFGRDDTHELPNSLLWGPDGWLYGWNGVFNPSTVTSRNGKTYEFTCAIFRIHPKTRVFEVWCEGTSNPWGIAIDPEGSFFASACVIDHLWHLVETGHYIRQGGPYPPYTWPIGSIVDHVHQKAAYCGTHYFDSPAYPPEYRGRLYMGNIHGNAINVDILQRNGSTYSALPASDFLRANDAWFMPVSQKTGPDGCLYILDWYDRYHCYQDANRDPAGIDRLKGRLYRVRYGETPRRVGFDLARASDDELVVALGSANVYDRDIAQRLLTERASPSILGKLESLVWDDSAASTARMHGLWALIGAGTLRPAWHAALLAYKDPAFRAWGVRAAGNSGRVRPEIRDKVVALARDPSPDVRLQVAIAARKLKDIDPVQVLLDVQRESDRDPLIPRVVWQNLHPLFEDNQERVARWLARGDGRETGFSRLAPRAIERLLASATADAGVIAKLIETCSDGDTMREALERLAARFRDRSMPAGLEASLRRELIPILKTTVARHGSPADLVNDCHVLMAYCGDLQSLAAVRNVALSARANDGSRNMREEMRIKSVEAFLCLERTASIRPFVAKVLAEGDSSSSIAFRGMVLDALDRLDDPELARIVLAALSTLPAQLKPRAIELLTHRPAWARALLDAVAERRIATSALNISQLRKLERSNNPEIADRVRSLWGTIRAARNPRRDLVVAQIRQSLRTMPGDPVAGQAVFSKLCAECHKIHGQGQDVGPDITANGRSDFDQLLSNVFDPSLIIGPGYQATTVATTDGRILTGLLAEDGKDRVTLRLQGGRLEAIPRSQVDEMKTDVISLMPEEIEKQLGPQEIADLFAFLCLDKPPSDPAAKPLPGAGPMLRRTARATQ
jgi:putative heme-binding domain-containing protein